MRGRPARSGTRERFVLARRGKPHGCRYLIFERVEKHATAGLMQSKPFHLNEHLH
jgi:hypothetical protein